MAVADVDVEAQRDGDGVGVVEAGVVYPDVGPEGRAEDLAQAHPAEDDYRYRSRLEARREWWYAASRTREEGSLMIGGED